MTKQETIFFYIYQALHLKFQGCYYSDYSKNLESLTYSIWIHATHHGNPPSKRQSKTKYEPVVYMCKETAENGMLLKEYGCVHASQVNYGKPLDSNKIIRRKFIESFPFLSYLSKSVTASSFILYQTRQNLVANLRLLSFFLSQKRKIL